MADALGKVEITPVRPTIVSVDPQDQSVVSVVSNETVVSVSAAGPKESASTLTAMQDLDVSNKVDKSLVYYDESSEMFKADNLHTVFTLSDGGNF